MSQQTLESKLLGTKVNFICSLRIIFRNPKLSIEEKYQEIIKLDKAYAKYDLKIIKESLKN